MASKSYTPVDAKLQQAEKQSFQSANIFKMVIIGETGSGKTSLIQLLLNYSKQYANAKEHYDLKAIESFVEEETQQMEKEAWESDTTTSKKYSATFGDFQLDIIDTPGFGDTRGEKQQQENTANIIGIVKKEIYINCVCLVINGTKARLTEAVKMVLSEIVSILPPEVLNNIIGIFTNVRDQLGLNFHAELLENFQLKISDDYLFALDNPFSRYNNASPASLAKFQKRLLRDFEETHETLDEMFALLKTLKPAVTIKFGEFHEVSQNIRDSFVNLQVHYANIRELKEIFANVDCEESKNKLVTYTKTILELSDDNTVLCTKCLKNCHFNCDCYFAFLFVQYCKVFPRGIVQVLRIPTIKFTTRCFCGHDDLDHSRSKCFYKKVEEEVHLTALDQKTKDEVLVKELAPYHQAVEKETEELKAKIKKIQCLSSIFYFSKIAVEAIEIFKKDIEKISDYKYTHDITATLDAILEVLHDPHTAKNNEAKFLWACGVLGVDPNNAAESNIEKLFRQLSKKVHPDATKDESTSTAFKHLNYAKDFLMTKLRSKK